MRKKEKKSEIRSTTTGRNQIPSNKRQSKSLSKPLSKSQSKSPGRFKNKTQESAQDKLQSTLHDKLQHKSKFRASANATPAAPIVMRPSRMETAQEDLSLQPNRSWLSHQRQPVPDVQTHDPRNAKSMRLALLIPLTEQFTPSMESQIADSLRMLVKEVIILKINENLQDSLSTYKPDLLLCIGNQAAQFITPELLSQSIHTKTAVWLNDPYEPCENIAFAYHDWDLVITQNMLHLPVYEKYGYKHIVVMPYSADPLVYKPHQPQPDFHSDLLIVGDYSEERLLYVHVIRQRFAGKKIRALGRNWESVDQIEIWQPSSETMLSAYYNGANMIVHWDAAPRPLYEIAACGVFQLVENSPEIHELMKPGEDVVIFSNPEQLGSKLQYYSENTDRKRMVASRALYSSKYDYSFLQSAMKLIYSLI
ncbi:glycosyltransferase [Paenibacillus sp. FSL H7-0326]|uniref:glycosyltransferase family protein n=1 Tax=Paenibacillus sp. FSL H7-0326 TaxID=1921144 RepID=UPI0009FB656A|nr:glycosyltransferase [Paenibacillus sp. FSL H7-0326]